MQIGLSPFTGNFKKIRPLRDAFFFLLQKIKSKHHKINRDLYAQKPSTALFDALQMLGSARVALTTCRWDMLGFDYVS